MMTLHTPQYPPMLLPMGHEQRTGSEGLVCLDSRSASASDGRAWRTNRVRHFMRNMVWTAETTPAKQEVA